VSFLELVPGETLLFCRQGGSFSHATFFTPIGACYRGRNARKVTLPEHEMGRNGSGGRILYKKQETASHALFLPRRMHAKEVDDSCLWHIGSFYMESSDPSAHENTDDLGGSSDNKNVPVTGIVGSLNSFFRNTTSRGRGEPFFPECGKLGNVGCICGTKRTARYWMQRNYGWVRL
jgi:hypothetical protein